MKELTKRLLLAGFIVPFLIIVINFLPFAHYLALSLVIMFFAYTGTKEFLLLSINRNRKGIKPYLAALPGLTFPVLFYLENGGYIKRIHLDIFFIFIVSIILILVLINYERKENTQALKEITAQITSLVYPGLFLAYTIKLISLPHSTGIFIFFLLVIFINDSAAYGFGLLFGRNSWKPFKVSPKKSLVGFIGGTLSAIAAGVIFSFLRPEVIPGSLWNTAVTAFILSLTADIGDLIESVIKRSAQVKDSGSLMLGRGGVLDSIDSLLFSAPVFYFILIFLAS